MPSSNVFVGVVSCTCAYVGGFALQAINDFQSFNNGSARYEELSAAFVGVWDAVVLHRPGHGLVSFAFAGQQLLAMQLQEMGSDFAALCGVSSIISRSVACYCTCIPM